MALFYKKRRVAALVHNITHTTMKSIYKILFLVAFCAIPLSSVSQTRPNDQALKATLQEKIERTQAQQDSTLHAIEVSRALYQSDVSHRPTHANNIVDLESNLYELREQLGRMNMDLSRLEMSQLATSMASSESKQGGSSRLLSNSFFAENLTPDELKRLSNVATSEAQIPPLVSKAQELYLKLQGLKKIYDSSNSQQEVDNTLSKAVELKAQLTLLDQQIQSIWGELNTFRSDKYLILKDLAQVDRLNLEQLEQDSRAVRRAESIAQEGLLGGASMFYMQRNLALKNEMALAQTLKMLPAMDSLKKEQLALSGKLVAQVYPDIIFAPRSLVLYGGVNTSGSAALKAISEIPELRLPEKGIYYAIQVALMQKPATSITMFKGAAPLQYQKLSDGRVRYTLGGFDNYAQAQKAVSQLFKAGFKAPIMVCWVDGAYTSAAKAKAEQEKRAAAGIKTGNVGSGAYKIEVAGAINSTISQDLRNIVESYAPGKQTARVISGNNYLFTITQFDTKVQADKLVEIITKTGIVGAKVEEIK